MNTLPTSTGERKQRILILTADAGFGHRTAANAAASALEEMYGKSCEIIILNPLEDKRAPFFLRDSQSDYDKMVRNNPELYRFGYDASDASVPTVIMEQTLTLLLFEVMRDIVRTYRPDVILSTYPLYQAPLTAVMTVTRNPIPLLVAVTDLATVHRLWFHEKVDLCMVPTPLVRDLALSYGLQPAQVKVTGLPINPEVVREKRSKAEIRQALGWRADMLTVLAVGSRRVDRLVETLDVINHFGLPIQIIVAAGKDQNLIAQLNDVQWHGPVKIYEYVHNVPMFMKAADFIICKAGGLVITEALACGRPMMLIDIIAGQETGNADYVVQNEAGDLALDSVTVLETLQHWMMDDRALLKKRSEHAQALGRPNAAYEVANQVWLAGLQASALSGTPPTTGRLRLIDFLSHNHVHWEDDSSNVRYD